MNNILKNFKIDIYLGLIFSLIIVLFKADTYAFILIIPILILSYYKIFVKRDISVILILMLSSRLMMGSFIVGNKASFNILNLFCNYLPIAIILAYYFANLKKLNLKNVLKLKWTILFTVFILLFSLFNISFALSVFTLEILPLILFLLLVLSSNLKDINYEYLLKFFRYSFIACLVVYLSPFFLRQMQHLFYDGIIFKEEISRIVLRVARVIPRHTGYVFDFRIMGQLACLYLLILYYLEKKNNYWDVVLLSIVCILTFSRGPLVILILLLIAIYAPKRIKITKRLIVISTTTFFLLLAVIIYSFNNETIQQFATTLNPFNKDNAISQRSMFVNYSLDRFYEKPLGNGIGSLSSPEADVKVFAGYTNLHKKIPDKVFYYKVGDAYLALSLAEKGILGFILLILSLKEIFYDNKNRVSLFFIIGLFINLIGTDIPKQGFYYFTLIVIYYGVSQYGLQKNTLKNNEIIS